MTLPSKSALALTYTVLVPLVFSYAGLEVTKVDGPPTGPSVRIQQLDRDETGPTSFRYYAPREGVPTKTDEWVYLYHNGHPDGTIAYYYYRDRDLGQTFTVGEKGFTFSAITVRLQPVDVEKADPAGAKVSIQLMRVSGSPIINNNGTTTEKAPNGRSTYPTDSAKHGTHETLFPDDHTAYTNPQWSTYASDWPIDPNEANTPKRWPIMHYSDDYIEGEHFEHIALYSGGIVPEGLTTNDYLRWEISDSERPMLEPNTTYAILFLFDEPAPPGVNRNIPLSNLNVVPEGKLNDPYPEGHTIRRDGSSTNIEDVFIYNVHNSEDVFASRESASFPSDMGKRLAIQPGTLGYPDVDTYRDLYFIIESE